MRKFFFKVLLLITAIALSNNFIFAQYEWTKYSTNPLNIHGSPGSWDESVVTPCVIFNSDLNRYEMWYTSYTGSLPNNGIGFAWSTDGITWTKHPTPVLTPSPSSWDNLFVGAACVFREGGTYKMWYTGGQSGNLSSSHIGYATSPDGIAWTKHSGNPVLSPGTGWESGAVGYPSVIKISSTYYMFYSGSVSVGIARTGRAISSDGITWTKYSGNPVLLPGDSGQWDQNNFLGKVIEVNNTLYIYYAGETNPGVSGIAIGGAYSNDMGITWTKFQNNPIIARGATGQWDNGWIESGSVIFAQNQLKLYYDGGGGATGNKGRVGLATSILVVPVELVSFTAEAENQKVILKWTTATELNNNGFEIQRKVSESEFATVGFVKGEGTTTNQREYSFVDKDLIDGKYFYRLKQVDYNGTYEYSNTIEVDVRSLNEYALEQNYPNPFNPATTIGYVLKEKTTAKLILLNAIGEEITVLVNEEQDKGYHKVDFDATNLPSGIYFYQLKAGSYVDTKKMILLK